MMRQNNNGQFQKIKRGRGFQKEKFFFFFFVRKHFVPKILPWKGYGNFLEQLIIAYSCS